MRASLALVSVTLALGTAVEGSPLNFAAIFARNNGGKTESSTAGQDVQLVSQKEGTCVSPAQERATEGTPVTLVECGQASAWRVDEKSGTITLVDNTKLALDAGRDISRGSKLALYNSNGSQQQMFKINEDGTVSIGKEQCLDIGNGLQTYTCDASNENQQFRATPVEKRTDDDKQDAHAQPTDKGVQSYGNETKAPPALIDEKK